jgi:hypothetical protein
MIAAMTRLRPWLPLLSVLAQLGLVWLGAASIDSSDLQQQPDSWGYFFVVLVLTFLYAGWPVLVILGTALVATLSSSVGTRRAATVAGAVVAGLVGLAGIGVGVAVGVDGQVEADTAFAVVCGAAGVVPLVAAVLLLRRLPAAGTVPVG